MPQNILAFAGSIRKDSFNKKLLQNAAQLAPEGMTITIHDLSDLPLYNTDLEDPTFPASVEAFKQAIAEADGLLIAVTEYNHSFSGVLKNAIDWASRPAGQSPLEGKPVILQSASPAWTGGLRAQYDLHRVLRYFEMKVQHFPEVFVGVCHTKFDVEGQLTDALAIETIRKQLAKFAEFIG